LTRSRLGGSSIVFLGHSMNKRKKVALGKHRAKKRRTKLRARAA